MEGTAWANPFLSIPKLAEMAGKDPTWIRAQLRKSENPIPHYADGSQPKILWSDYVEWYKANYAPGSDHYRENAGKKHARAT